MFLRILEEQTVGTFLLYSHLCLCIFNESFWLFIQVIAGCDLVFADHLITKQPFLPLSRQLTRQELYYMESELHIMGEEKHQDCLLWEQA